MAQSHKPCVFTQEAREAKRGEHAARHKSSLITILPHTCSAASSKAFSSSPLIPLSPSLSPSLPLSPLEATHTSCQFPLFSARNWRLLPWKQEGGGEGVGKKISAAVPASTSVGAREDAYVVVSGADACVHVCVRADAWRIRHCPSSVCLSFILKRVISMSERY